MKIPFSRQIAKSYSLGEPLIEALPEYKEIFQKLFITIENNYG